MSEDLFSPTRARFAPIVAASIAIAAQLLLRHPVVLIPRWIAPAIEIVLLVVLIVGGVRDRGGADRLRRARFALGSIMAISATGSALYLINQLFDHADLTVAQLVSQGIAILVTANVGFSIVYWQLDRGGPDGRMRPQPEQLAFWFTQDAIREYSDEFDGWQPQYIDYMYLSYTNIIAFSPTDTMPLTRPAKLLMTWQSTLAMATLAIVFALAINILN